jgi:3-oxoacyl-[acyl-carrier-protein] synthase-1
MAGLAIKACGLVTSVGFNAAASLAAIRSGIRGVRETNLWDAQSGTYLAAGKVSLPQWCVGIGKLAELAAPAISECFSAANPVWPNEIPVLLGVAPHERPFRPTDLDNEILAEVEHRLRVRLHPASRVIARDHVSAVVALREAENIIDNGQAECVVVAAVDSLLQQDLVEHYIAKRRLLTPNNSNGFSPGEAGSAVLVVPARGKRSGELRILGMALAQETATIESDEPLQADGLTRAIHGAFNDGSVAYDDLHYRITDLNGEHYKFKEMTFAMIRFQRKPKPRLFDLWHPIEFTGDVGAAIGPIVLSVARHAGHKGYGVGPTILCTFGNDNGERAAMVVSYSVEQRAS